jgi:hypothetical protein
MLNPSRSRFRRIHRLAAALGLNARWCAGISKNPGSRAGIRDYKVGTLKSPRFMTASGRKRAIRPSSPMPGR